MKVGSMASWSERRERFAGCILSVRFCSRSMKQSGMTWRLCKKDRICNDSHVPNCVFPFPSCSSRSCQSVGGSNGASYVSAHVPSPSSDVTASSQRRASSRRQTSSNTTLIAAITFDAYHPDFIVTSAPYITAEKHISHRHINRSAPR